MNYYFNQSKAQSDLKRYFKSNKTNLNSFGSRVNQTFEAYVFAKVIEYYKNNGWNTTIINPQNSSRLKLKFSTRGEPKNFSYCIAQKGKIRIQIRHQLRVDIFKTFRSQAKPSNICCDIVVMEDVNIDHFKTYHSVPNINLICFGEVKHMSAFAELIAGFIGLVHELQPNKLKRIRIKKYKKNSHLSPFLFVSGILLNTASGIDESIKIRKYDIDLYSSNRPIP